MKMKRALVIAIASCLGRAALGAQHPAMPAGMTHEQHRAEMQKPNDLNARGARAMGFDQTTTAHHFRLAERGGAIEVDVLDPSDEAGRSAIRAHLQTIAQEFAEGRFEAPLATHGELPPGADTMQRLRSAIDYAYEATPNGGRVRISTGDAEALRAVHAFLRYQIREHRTGDPEGVVDRGEDLR